MSQKNTSTTTIHSDSYAPFGEIVTGLPDRPSRTPEQFEQERLADRVKYFDLLREMRWTEAEFEIATRLGFPDSILFVHTRPGPGERLLSP